MDESVNPHKAPEPEEKCFCGRPARHKVGEETGPSWFHNMTAYLCCEHMRRIGMDCSKYPGYDTPNPFPNVGQLDPQTIVAIEAARDKIVAFSVVIRDMIFTHLGALNMDTPEDQAVVIKMLETIMPWGDAVTELIKIDPTKGGSRWEPAIKSAESPEVQNG